MRLVGSGKYDAVLISDSAIGTDQNVKYVFVVGPDNHVQYRAGEARAHRGWHARRA